MESWRTRLRPRRLDRRPLRPLVGLLWFGLALAFVAIVMAAIARTPFIYEVGVLIYSFFVGAGYAAFSAMVMHAIGKGVASTKYAFCQSLGNLPVVYMTALNGYVHDRFGPELDADDRSVSPPSFAL